MGRQLKFFVHDRGGESQLTTPTRICAVGVSPALNYFIMMNLQEIISLGTRRAEDSRLSTTTFDEIDSLFEPVGYALTESNSGVIRLRLKNAQGAFLNVKAGPSVQLPKKGSDLDKIKTLIDDYVVYYGTVVMKDRETGEVLVDEDGDPRLAAWFSFGVENDSKDLVEYSAEDIFELKKPKASKPARTKVRPA